ncbi:uncharacterized protein LOC132925130 [Rhopalosiphum padi]|uniref:uncharacterized protein LOC132925130 n=1 Tax=Rhopalosiphum padi TaxID=40932 RepID=UPI00298E88E0|nr:uncharacterized protein LOC132925130 [Rhopalosiphum padi]
MLEPEPNTTIEGTKSLPCIELSSPILNTSDHSFASYKSFNTVHEREIQKPTEVRSNVKALIDKHRSFQENLLNSQVNDFNTKQKSFANACKNVGASDNDCTQMKGDTKQMENVENVVKNHVYNVFTAHIVNNQKPLQVEKHIVSKSKDFDFKIGTPERFWQNVVSVVSINNAYYQCLKQLIDKQKCKTLEDVIVHVDSMLKIAGDDSELIGLELVASSKQYFEKFGIVLDSKLNEALKKSSFLTYDSKMTALRMELAENKRRTKIAENSVAQLQKEKKDLLNILTSYDSENIHKISLEKRLEVEQQQNNELRDLISNIFNKKMPFTYSQ